MPAPTEPRKAAARNPWEANRPAVCEEDVLEAYRTRANAQQQPGSKARDVAGYLGCQSTWDAIELEMRRRLAEARLLQRALRERR